MLASPSSPTWRPQPLKSALRPSRDSTVSSSQASRRSMRLSLPDAPCSRCLIPFANGEEHIMVQGSHWHRGCFRCAQCFLLLEDNIYFHFDGRNYCQHDFEKLYAPICAKCGTYVMGKVMKALNGSYHPHCFQCEQRSEDCEIDFEHGMWYVDGKMVCQSCKNLMPRTPMYICNKCHQPIDQLELLKYDKELYHCYHFDCTDCKKVLSADARTIKDQLYCPRCYDLRCDICPECKKPIDKEHERSVIAMDKHWHVDHFCCAKCGKPFMGKEHFEYRGKAYCTEDYLILFGDYCHRCSNGLTGTSVRLFGKGWCSGCYRCFACEAPLTFKSKVLEEDGRPMCKKCMNHKSFQKVLTQRNEEQALRKKQK